MDENSVVERLEKVAELTDGQIRLQEKRWAEPTLHFY
jgi:hypothetical protein